GVKQQHRWIVTFCFGLIHGFGFSFLLTESMQFAGSHLVMSLLSFNLGVELGQILVVLIAVPVVQLLFRYALPEKAGVILLSAILGHWAWHWMEERWTNLAAYDIRWPDYSLELIVSLMQWGALLGLSGGVLWTMNTLFSRYFVRPVEADSLTEANATRD